LFYRFLYQTGTPANAWHTVCLFKKAGFTHNRRKIMRKIMFILGIFAMLAMFGTVNINSAYAFSDSERLEHKSEVNKARAEQLRRQAEIDRANAERLANKARMEHAAAERLEHRARKQQRIADRFEHGREQNWHGHNHRNERYSYRDY
jgi:hypothetical protein